MREECRNKPVADIGLRGVMLSIVATMLLQTPAAIARGYCFCSSLCIPATAAAATSAAAAEACTQQLKFQPQHAVAFVCSGA